MNYKDILATKINSGVIKQYPIVPGIDLSGVVLKSNSSNFTRFDKVLVTGYGLGISANGGLEEYAVVPADWIIKLPQQLSLKDAMLYGTAGLTAGLSVHKLLQHNIRKDDNILITGGTGGVASISLAILKKLKFRKITVTTRKISNENTLKELGATKVITNNDLITHKLLDHQKYDFVIDTIGEKTIPNILPQIKYGGGISICGNVSGAKLNTTILPFILRNITMYGIDSVNIPNQDKANIWRNLAAKWNVTKKLKKTLTKSLLTQ